MNVDPKRLLAIDAAAQGEGAGDFELWPQNWSAWQVFTGAGSQWRRQMVVAGSSVVTKWSSPDYPAVEIVMRRYGVPTDEQDEVFGLYQVMESEALKVLNSET